MSNDDGCLKGVFMLLAFNAALVGACYAFALVAPLIPYLLVGAVVVGIIAAISRRPDPLPPAPVRPPEPEIVRWTPPPAPEIEYLEDPTFDPPQFEQADDWRADPVVILEGPRCLICRSELGDDVIFCWRCRTPHHRACFRYTGECAVYACRCRRYRKAG